MSSILEREVRTPIDLPLTNRESEILVAIASLAGNYSLLMPWSR